MKALPLLLATSLAANAAWFASTLLRPPSAEARSAAGNIAGATASGHPSTSTGSPSAITAAPSDKTLALALNSDDPAQLRDALRAAGVDDETVRQLVSQRVWKKYESRFKALQPQTQPDPAIWWKNPEQLRHQRQSQTREQREASRELHKAIREETEALLGKPDAPQINPWQQRQYGFLADEKRELLQRVEQDYNELIGEVNNETMGFQLPSDREQLRFLNEEKRRDIESLLTPEELRAYDLRNSPTAQQLRWKMTQMDASEEEYLKIFDLQKNYDRLYNDHQNHAEPVERDQAYWKARQEAEKELKAQIRATIGDERYLDYVMSNDHGFQQVRAAALRFGLPEDTPRKVYALRQEIPSDANRIADDPNLTDEQKRAGLTALADTARDQIRAQLGAEAAEIILKNSSFRWIGELEKGNITTYDEHGGQHTRRLPKPAPAKKP